jgi:hypothetical protein
MVTVNHSHPNLIIFTKTGRVSCSLAPISKKVANAATYYSTDNFMLTRISVI